MAGDIQFSCPVASSLHQFDIKGDLTIGIYFHLQMRKYEMSPPILLPLSERGSGDLTTAETFTILDDKDESIIFVAGQGSCLTR